MESKDAVIHLHLNFTSSFTGTEAVKLKGHRSLQVTFWNITVRLLLHQGLGELKRGKKN